MSGFYKVPLDEVLDKDIIDWIASFPRNKKGEIVRHAIRYYMNAQQSQGAVFLQGGIPVAPVQQQQPVQQQRQQPVQQQRQVDNETSATHASREDISQDSKPKIVFANLK